MRHPVPLRLVAVTALVAGGCASRALTEPATTTSTEHLAVLAAVGAAVTLLTYLVAWWFLGRPPTLADPSALLVAYGAVLAIGAGILVPASAARAEALLERPVGDEPAQVLELVANCGVIIEDGLNIYRDDDSCDVDAEPAFAVPLFGIAAGLFLLGGGLRHGDPGCGLVALGVLGVGGAAGIAVVAFLQVSTAAVEAFLWLGGLGLLGTVFAAVAAWTAGGEPVTSDTPEHAPPSRREHAG